MVKVDWALQKKLTTPNRARNLIVMNPVRINYHTAVTNGGSLHGFFNSQAAKGVFSHFYVTRDGGLEQYQDTRFRASCDLDGNPDTISIEAWDGYPKGYPGYWKNDSDVPPYNDAQMETLAKVTRQLLHSHPSIPAKLAIDNNRNGTSSHGLSTHRLGVPGYMKYSNGLRYSLYPGKVCPGSRRIAQIPEILQEATKTTIGGTTTSKGFFDMAELATHHVKSPQIVSETSQHLVANGNQKWWLLHASPGLVDVRVHGYGTAGPHCHIQIVAENDSTGSSRLLGRVPLPIGTNGFSGQGIGYLQQGESLRLKVTNFSGKPVEISNLYTSILTEE